MSNAKSAEVKNKGSPFEGVTELLLVNRHCIDQNVPHGRADLIPFGAIISQATQNDRTSFGNLYVVMIGMFSADCDRVRADVGGRVYTGSDRVRDNLGSTRRGNLKEIVAEELDHGIGSRRVSRSREAAGHVELSTGGI